MNLEQAYHYCQTLASEHYENFPTASKLIRADLRPAVAAIYAFARTADDIADEGDASPEQRLKQLDNWEALLDNYPESHEQQCIHLALNDAIARFNLPRQALHDLLHAFRMDCRPLDFADEAALLFYCQHSANPVGRLMLALHGIHDDAALRASDAICSALQLTNFWQDFTIDHAKGRCYLADTWLQRHKLDKRRIMRGELTSRQAMPAIAEAFAFTHQLFQQGRALFICLPFRLRLQIVATWHGGMHILQASERLPDPLHTRPKLGKKDWLMMIPLILRDTLFPPRAKA